MQKDSLLRYGFVHQERSAFSPYSIVPVPLSIHDWVHGHVFGWVSLSPGCFQLILRQLIYTQSLRRLETAADSATTVGKKEWSHLEQSVCGCKALLHWWRWNAHRVRYCTISCWLIGFQLCQDASSEPLPRAYLPTWWTLKCNFIAPKKSDGAS